MADITMCEGTDCVDKMSCYRHTAPFNNRRQTVFAEVPLRVEGCCSCFWDNKGYSDGPVTFPND